MALAGESLGRVNSVMGAIEIKKGMYEEAAISFENGDSLDTSLFNRGLLLILIEDYDGAIPHLTKSCESETLAAKSYYLLAVAHAGKGDVDGLKSNLAEAVALNSGLKEKALSDLEFSKHKDLVIATLK